MLFRNSEWTRKLLAEMCAHAHKQDLVAMRAVRLASCSPSLLPLHVGCQTDAAIQIERNSLQQHRRDPFEMLMLTPQELEKEVKLLPGLHSVFGFSQYR